MMVAVIQYVYNIFLILYISDMFPKMALLDHLDQQFVEVQNVSLLL